MTMTICNKWINDLRSERELVDSLVHIANLARISGDKSSNAYDDAAFYISTGRVSGTCARLIRQNIKAVCKWLNRANNKTTEEIGEYLKTYSE